MKIKNISVGDPVQIKKSMCHSEFKAKQVCEVVDIDHTDKHGFDVLIQGKNCLDWVNHKHLKKPEPQLKQLDQSVFDGLDEKWRFAAINKAGRLMLSKSTMASDENYWHSCFAGDLYGKDTGYDTSNWQNSLIERDIAKELLEVDLSSELTGSELCRAMKNKNDWVLAYVSDENDATAEFHQRPAIVTGATVDGRFKCGEITWRYAVPINNQGEPLTQSDVGL